MNVLSNTPAERLERARTSLTGLHVGDCFGDLYFVRLAEELVEQRLEMEPTWAYTDDTAMAISIYLVLKEFGEIRQDELALDFANRYQPGRGYGPSMHGQLRSIIAGEPWRDAAAAPFEGQGSYGNGAAMRVAPLGAYFADDLDKAVEQARLSAEVTHIHPEGVAGAIAVAVAAAQAVRFKNEGVRPTRAEFIDSVVPYIPDSIVRAKSVRARDLAPGSTWRLASSTLGNGHQVSAQDTVPFCLWSAGEYLDNYEEAMWITLSALGDRDTTCAIVGGIIAGYTGIEAIPERWLSSCESIEEML